MASYMSTEYLRLGALVGDTIRLFRTRSWSFVLVAGAVLVPLGLLDAALGQLSQPEPVTHALSEIGEVGIQWQTIKSMLLSSWAWGLAAGLLVSALVHPLLQGVLVRMASQVILAEPHHLLGAVRYAARRWFRILLARVLVDVASILPIAVPSGCVILASMSATLNGSSTSDVPSLLAVPLLVLLMPLTIAGVVTFIAIGVRLNFVTHAIIVEDQGTLDSIRRSWELTRGEIWRLIGYSIILMIVILPVVLIVGLLGRVLPWIDMLSIGGWITTPFVAIADTLIFYGLRGEQERYGGTWRHTASASTSG